MSTAAWLISIPLLSSPAIYLAGRAAVHRQAAQPDVGRVAWWLSVTAAAAMWLVVLQAAVELQTTRALNLVVGGLALRVDGASLLMTALMLGASTLVIVFCGAAFSDQPGAEKYFAMLLATTGAVTGMVCAQDLFNLWLWFEALLVTSFLLVSFYRQRPASLDASVKYLVQSAAGSMLILLGIALVLAQTGGVSLQAADLSQPALLAAGALFLVGFGVKCALVPMHTWLPDAYAESPSGTGALLAGAVTVSGLVALLRALAPLAEAAAVWGPLLMAFGAINMLAGNLLALRQPDLKRLLAYSSISHIGFIALGLGIGLTTGRADAAQAGLFHMATHAVMKTLAFLAAGAALLHLGRRDDGERPLLLSDLQGLAQTSGLIGAGLALALLSLAGIPPLAGFMSKWQIFAAGLASQDAVIGWLVLFAALNSLFSLAYYLPPVIAIYRHDAPAASGAVQPVPGRMAAPLLVLIGLILIVGLWPDAARWLTETAAAALLSVFPAGSGL